MGEIFREVKRKRGCVLGRRSGGKVEREGGGWAVWGRFLRK